MANYYATARTNYFRVNDVEGLRAILPSGIKLHTRTHLETETEFVCLLDEAGDGWPGYIWNEEGECEEEFDWVERVAPFLLDDEVAIFMEAGNEKLRYISAYAFAFNNKGETKTTSISDIYRKARKLGNNITAAEY